jgi:heme exporter protein D
MYFDNLHALLVMDGHGAYVWAAYLVTLLVIVAMLAVPVRQHRRVLLQLGAELKRAQSRPPVGGDR